jgi:hypothetical protein
MQICCPDARPGKQLTNPFLHIRERRLGPGIVRDGAAIDRSSMHPTRDESGGGGRRVGSIATTLAKYWSVTVFTLEPWFGGAHRQTLAANEGVWDRVIGLNLKAQELPFADETFDAIN